MAKTISAYVNDQLAKLFDQVVRADGHTRAQVAARAVDLYTILPAEARRALAYVREYGSSEDQHALLLEFARAASRVQFEIARRSAVAAMRTGNKMTEDEIDRMLAGRDRLTHREALATVGGKIPGGSTDR